MENTNQNHQLEGQTANGEDESEEISESFLCCICLDLLFKPVVLQCGHVSCFWCVHKSMSGGHESHCPICRQTYKHFPNICLMLHRLLLKMYPVAYKKRGKQILEEEKETGIFSPELDGDSGTGQPLDEDFSHQAYSTHYSARTEGDCGNVEHSECISPIPNNYTSIGEQTCGEMLAAMGKNMPENKLDGNDKQFSIADLLCIACNQLLVRPVALNCGHVYCESCIASPAEEQLRCQDCQSLHPGGFPKVCLLLENLLLEQFSKEYASRKDAVQLKETQFKHERMATCSADAEKQSNVSAAQPAGERRSLLADSWTRAHGGVGCDSCGMYPIIGDRYQCQDCKEVIGFDLCGACYNNPSKFMGRFNQHHTPEHRMELKNPNRIRHIMLRLMTGHLEDGSTAFVLADDVPESPENAPSINSYDNNQNNATGDSISTVSIEFANATDQHDEQTS